MSSWTVRNENRLGVLRFTTSAVEQEPSTQHKQNPPSSESNQMRLLNGLTPGPRQAAERQRTSRAGCQSRSMSRCACCSVGSGSSAHTCSCAISITCALAKRASTAGVGGSAPSSSGCRGARRGDAAGVGPLAVAELGTERCDSAGVLVAAGPERAAAVEGDVPDSVAAAGGCAAVIGE